MTEQLLWSRAEAAEALGIGERLLEQATLRGEVPVVRLGRRVLYPVAGLRRWVDDITVPAGGVGPVQQEVRRRPTG